MIRYFWPSDDEQLAGQWNDSHLDEDGGWWANVQQCGATLALAVTLALTGASTAAAQGVFSQSQDDPAGNLVGNVFIYEDYQQNLPPPVNWPQPAVITYDDTHVPFVETFQVDEDFWVNLVPPVQATNYLNLPFIEQDPTPGFVAAVPVLDEGLWTPQNPPWDQYWTLLFFLDDGSAVPAFQPDEDFWVSGVAPSNWPQPPQPFQAADDDNFSQLFSANDEAVWTPQVPPVADSLRLQQPFVFEQNEQAATLVSFATEDYWQNPVAPVPDSIWLLRQDNFEQTDATGSLSSNLEEGLWLNPVLPDPGGLLLLQPFSFDYVEEPTFIPFTDELYWQNPVLPVPDSLWVLRQDLFETNDPAGSLAIDLDEGLWLNPAPPVPLSFALLQQFQFEQNEPAGSLYVIPNEEYWQNPVPPVVWPQPSVFVADESIQTFVASFQPDEDLWQQFVQPVVAANLYNQPFNILGNQEDDVPVLSPAQPPPPPPFCPLPPTGPDSDVAMSTFGGKQPTLALFCRICNSGKPLVVRADYAIWCQDCCAFVSKQDTYMGTVRAPGQFRSIF